MFGMGHLITQSCCEHMLSSLAPPIYISLTKHALNLHLHSTFLETYCSSISGKNTCDIFHRNLPAYHDLGNLTYHFCSRQLGGHALKYVETSCTSLRDVNNTFSRKIPDARDGISEGRARIANRIALVCSLYRESH